MAGAPTLFVERSKQTLTAAHARTLSQPNWCAVVALGAKGWPDARSQQYFDPHSHDRQRQMLCCLFLDNDVWRTTQRSVLRMPAWNAVWKRMECVMWRWLASFSCLVSDCARLCARSLDAQSDLMVQRLPQPTGASAPRRLSARTRARDRLAAPALLRAPFVYPLGDADAVTLYNSALDRCAAVVAASALLNRVLIIDLNECAHAASTLANF